MQKQEYESSKEINEYEFNLNSAKISIYRDNIPKPLIKYTGDLEFKVHGLKLSVKEKLLDLENNTDQSFKLNIKNMFSFNNQPTKNIELIIPTYEISNVEVDFNYLSVLVNSLLLNANIENLTLGKCIMNISSGSVSIRNFKSNFININTADSVVEMEKVDSDDIRLSSACGNISLKDVSSQSLNIIGCTGNIELMQSNFDNVDVKLTSGDLMFIDGKTKELSINTVAGDSVIENVDSVSTKIDTSVGDISMQRGILDNITLKTSAGNVLLREIVPKNININTFYGDVEIEVLESSVNYNTNLDTCGDVWSLNLEKGLPRNIFETKGEINVQSKSGDILVSFKDKQKKL